MTFDPSQSMLSDQEIQQQNLNQPQQSAQPQQSFIRRNAGTIGAIGAGLLAAPFTGGLSLLPTLGIAAGAGAIGAGLGEYTGQKLNKEQTNIGAIEKQGIMGGIGNATGELIGPAFKGIMSAFSKGGANALADTASNVAGKTASKGLADELASKTAASAFTVPRAIAERIKPADVMSQMLDYGINSKTMNGLKGVVNNVTGSSGIINKMVTEAASKTKSPIPLDTVFQGMKNLGDTLPELATQDQIAIKKMIGNIVTPTNGSAGILKTSALDALDAVRKLEAQGYKFYNAANRAGGTDQLINSAKAKLFLGAADDLKMATDQAIGKAGIDMVKTPEALMQISKVSPKLSQQVMSAKNLSDLRSIQSPFVRLGQMISETENAANTAFTKGAGSASRLAGAAGGFALGHIPGAIAGYVAEPLLEGVGQAVNAPIKLGAAQAIKGASGLVNAATPVLGNAAKFTAGNALVGMTQPGQPSIQQPDQNQPDSTDQLSQLTQQPQDHTKAVNDAISAMMLQDIQKTGGKNITALKALQDQLTGGTQSATQMTAQKALSNANSSLNIIENAIKNVNTAPSRTSPEYLIQTGKNKISAFQGNNPNIETINNTGPELLAIIKGLTGSSRILKSEIDNISLPTINDTKIQAQGKIDRIRRILNSATIEISSGQSLPQ
ncbi:MAG: hypothetical protein WCO77_11360 [bacterium]